MHARIVREQCGRNATFQLEKPPSNFTKQLDWQLLFKRNDTGLPTSAKSTSWPLACLAKELKSFRTAEELPKS